MRKNELFRVLPSFSTAVSRERVCEIRCCCCCCKRGFPQAKPWSRAILRAFLSSPFLFHERRESGREGAVSFEPSLIFRGSSFFSDFFLRSLSRPAFHFFPSLSQSHLLHKCVAPLSCSSSSPSYWRPELPQPRCSVGRESREAKRGCGKKSETKRMPRRRSCLRER